MVKKVGSISRMKNIIDSLRFEIDQLSMQEVTNRRFHELLNELSINLNPLCEEYNGEQQ